MRRLLFEGLWIAGGHLVAGLAVLIGTRLITELAEPALFGQYALLNGALALLQGLLFQPMGQAAMCFYPEFAARGEATFLRAKMHSTFRKRSTMAAGTVLAIGLVDAATVRALPSATWAALALSILLEAWKTLEIVMRNAARRQKSYALLLAADSLARPAGAVLFAWTLGATVEALLFGQALGVAGVLAALHWVSEDRVRGTLADVRHRENDPLPFQEMDRFAAPLLWLPVVGWLGALGDRYIVAGVLGMSQAGIYATAYGIASRPLLLLGGVAEATFRQPYYNAVAKSDVLGSKRYVALWLSFNLVLGVFTFLLIWIFADLLTSLLLASAYKEAITLLPWIAVGHVPLIAAQALTRVAYAHQRTGAAVRVEATSAAIAVISAAIGAYHFALVGVAMAVPVYCTCQLALTAWVVRGGRQ